MKKIIWIAVLCWLWVLPTAASDIPEDKQKIQYEMEEQLLDKLDLSAIDQMLIDMFPKEKMSFTAIVKSVIKGEFTITAKLMGELIENQIFYEFQYNRKNLAHIIVLAIMAAVLSNFSNVFQNKQIGEMSFYILYLLILTLCLDSFRVVITGVGGGLERLLTFMEVLSPAYFLAVGISSGGSTAILYYQMVLFFIFIIELVISNFLLPLIHMYIMVEVMNHLSLEDNLSKLSELIHLLIGWILKSLLACVIGLNVIQGLITPVIDSLKRTTLTKTAEAIPGIGDAIGGAAEVMLGTTVLIKNGIGVSGAMICIIICMVPLIQMTILTFLYKLIAAVIQPISDKRIVNCISSIGEGYLLLVRVIFTTGILFLLTIAVVTSVTT